tara:strand:+ start:2178 stop:2477 length:300 start_codon:yes stop_codon:yes gene_type:complete
LATQRKKDGFSTGTYVKTHGCKNEADKITLNDDFPIRNSMWRRQQNFADAKAISKTDDTTLEKILTEARGGRRFRYRRPLSAAFCVILRVYTLLPSKQT